MPAMSPGTSGQGGRQHRERPAHAQHPNQARGDEELHDESHEANSPVETPHERGERVFGRVGRCGDRLELKVDERRGDDRRRDDAHDQQQVPRIADERPRPCPAGIGAEPGAGLLRLGGFDVDGRFVAGRFVAGRFVAGRLHALHVLRVLHVVRVPVFDCARPLTVSKANPLRQAHRTGQHNCSDDQEAVAGHAQLVDQQARHFAPGHGSEDGPDAEDRKHPLGLRRLEDGIGHQPELRRDQQAVNAYPSVEHVLGPHDVCGDEPPEPDQVGGEEERHPVYQPPHAQRAPQPRVQHRDRHHENRRQDKDVRQLRRAPLRQEEAVPHGLNQVQRDQQQKVVDGHQQGHLPLSTP